MASDTQRDRLYTAETSARETLGQTAYAVAAYSAQRYPIRADLDSGTTDVLWGDAPAVSLARVETDGNATADRCRKLANAVAEEWGLTGRFSITVSGKAINYAGRTKYSPLASRPTYTVSISAHCGRHEATVLHEMAHVACGEYYGADYGLSWSEKMAHGPEFAGTVLAVVARYASDSAANAILAAYTAAGVEYDLAAGNAILRRAIARTA